MIEKDLKVVPLRQAVQCEKHGVFYNPNRFDGCVICRRARRTSSRSRGAWVIFALFVIGIAFLFGSGLLLDSQQDPQADDSQAIAGQAAPAGSKGSGTSAGVPSRNWKLNAEPFRARIVALESLLFQDRPADFATGGRISSAAMELAGLIRSFEPRSKTGAVAVAVLGFAGRVDAQGDVGYAVLDLPDARSRWERLRGEIFSPAAWFRQSGRQLDEAQQIPAPEIDAETVDGLREVSSDLEMLIERGRPEAEAFGEPYVDAPERSRALSQLGTDWNRWSRAWMADLDRIGARFPRQPSMNSDSGVLAAYNHLSRALQELHAVPHGANDSGIPFRSLRKSRFEQAARHLEDCRRALDELR